MFALHLSSRFNKFSSASFALFAFLTTFLALGAYTRPAHAQACCAGANALSPARLNPHEDVLAGAQVRGMYTTGSFDANRHYFGVSGTELDFEEDVIGAIRPVTSLPGQVAVWIPIVETWRKNTQDSEFGAGIGDLNLSLRYDFFAAGQSEYVPGIAVLAGVTFPTGTPTDKASKPLHTDVTGIGVVQGTLGLALEQTYDKVLLNLTGLLTQRARRTVDTPSGSLSTLLGLQYTAIGAVGYAFAMETALAFVVTYTGEGDAEINDEVIPDSGKAATTVSLAGGMPILDKWRAQASVFDMLPISHFGQAQSVGAGATFALLRSWP